MNSLEFRVITIGYIIFVHSLLRDEQDSELRERALFWLGQSKDPRVAEFLLELIRGTGRIRL